MDPAGGTSYTSLGAQQLVSVPYALYAKKAANVSGTTNYIPKFTPNGTTIGNSRIFDTGNYTGIGTAFPVWDLDLHNPTGSQTMFHITNSSTGVMEGDGLTLGLVSASGDATLTNGEAGKYLSFGTAGTERMRIDPSGNVGIGTTTPAYKLDVTENAFRVGNFINTNTTSDYYGVYAACNNTPFYGIGVNALGGYIGINAEATLAGTGTRYGIYAYAAGSSTNWAVYAAGSAYSTGTWQTSDERFKTDISPLDNAISKINRLEPRSYNFKAKEYAYMGLPEELQYGFMAQDLEKVFPELVRDIQQPIKASAKEEGMIQFKGINYVELIPVMVKGMQEQQQIIEALNAEMEALKKEVQSLKK